MRIQYSPVVIDAPKLRLACKGEMLAVAVGNETSIYDLSAFPEGGCLAQAEELCGLSVICSVQRIGGELEVTVLYPIGANASEEERFPQPFALEESDELPEGEIKTLVWELPREPESAAEERIEALEGELLVSYLAQAELYERTLALEEENLTAMEALAEIYEIMIGG